jgi:hypothetical protein
LKYQGTLASIAGALPALGIVACVLGVIKTMGAIDQPPPVLGGLIGSALVGTFLGVFVAYGVFDPLANRLGQIIDEVDQLEFTDGGISTTSLLFKLLLEDALQKHGVSVEVEVANLHDVLVSGRGQLIQQTHSDLSLTATGITDEHG